MRKYRPVCFHPAAQNHITLLALMNQAPVCIPAVVLKGQLTCLFCSHTDALSLQDLHSLILLLCPDMPLRVTRSAFKAATPLLPFGKALTHYSKAIVKPDQAVALPFTRSKSSHVPRTCRVIANTWTFISTSPDFQHHQYSTKLVHCNILQNGTWDTQLSQM